jgi:protein-disulfide isomerase
MRPPRTLIIITLLVLLSIGGLLSYFSRSILPKPISIQTNGNPTLGSSAPAVDVVLFFDPKCGSCKEFHDVILPELQKKYIQTNKVRLTFIPVSIVAGSSLGSNALLCVYHQAPLYPNTDLFFKFLSILYQHQTDTWTNESLLELASKTDVTINLPKLKSCADLHKWDPVIEKNTDYGKSLVGGHLTVPTLFVNGVKLKEISTTTLFALIELHLKHQGDPS